MADDKPTLTRRRVLGGVATIGVAGALGSATWAQMQDTESFGNTVTAGVLDIEVDGSSETLPLEYGPVQNGDNVHKRVTVNNTGNIDANYLCVEITNVESDENGLEEPERDLDDGRGSGELAQYLTVTTLIGPDLFGATAINPGPVTADDTRQCAKLKDPLVEGGEQIMDITVSVAEEDISKAMSDTVSFDLELTFSDAPLNDGSGSGN